MSQSFWKRFWWSTRRSYGAFVIVLSLPTAIFLWQSPPTTRVPLGIVIVASMLGVAVLVTFAHMAFSAIQEHSGRLPRVIHSRKGTGAFKDYLVVCLLEQSELFSHGVAVSFYFKDSGEFEVLIGTGLVLNVQVDRRIQVGLTKALTGQKHTVDKLRENNSDTLQRLIVKPSVPADVMSSRMSGGLDD